MTTAVPTPRPHASRLHLLPMAVVASVVHLLLMIPGYSEDGSLQVGPWAAGLVFSLAVSLVLFLGVVPGRGAVTGVVLGGVALVSVVVFWAGVTLPFAAAAGILGWHAYSGRRRMLAALTLGLAASSAVALVAIIYGDATVS